MTKRLLVIDDSPSVRRLVEMAFRQTSYHLTFARTGVEGIAAASRDPADAILIDDTLPDMRGLDVCASLVADRRLSRLPIVLLTGLVEEVKRRGDPAPSVIEYLTKPFSCEELLARVSAVVGTNAIGKPSGTMRVAAEKPELAAGRAPLSGSLHDWPVADLVTLVGASGRTGVLRVIAPGATDFALAYFRAGELVLVTSSEPQDHAAERLPVPSAIPADALSRAEDEQRATGKPACVTLAEVGLLRAATLVDTLHYTSRQLLKRILDARDLHFSWQDLAVLPSWVDAYGKYVPMTRNTLVYTHPRSGSSAPPPSLNELAIERVREVSFAARDTWPTGDRVLTRCRGFCEKVRGLALSSLERRILALVNDHATLREIAARVVIHEDDARRIAHVLTAVGLLNASAFPRLEVDVSQA